jgi:hypothetical protein
MSKIQEGEPSRYHLGTSSTTIDIAINKGVAPDASGFPIKDMDVIRKYLQLPQEFILPSPDREWGFGPVLKLVDSPNPGWLIYQATLPDGISSKDDNDAFQVAATLGILFHDLNTTDRISNSTVPQNLTVSLNSGRNWRDGNPIWVTINKPLVRWINMHLESALAPAIENTMTEAFNRISGNRSTEDQKYYRNKIKFRMSAPKFVSFDVPGDASLNSGTALIYENSNLKGYELSSHNVDRVVSQLTLLTGIAKLEELAFGNCFEKKS